ncbi:N-acetylmuramoyl-L-alanine amidase [Tumebacillus sp. ITR2]|uniref:N-acetylmuramoyl-L-alanine amidase n=1 Tax=Tumebacillus amylolyticus TaxID=2801339 RepID=A0ABS1JCE1_9BACL|nr:N-acetylmuramoyl-L-alanine amidase [Tumebacillus amylolyticus]MBL0387938.1 N-acetylmuramoyl-L-alanine amidase [Tumebacillus amylolyticus]
MTKLICLDPGHGGYDPGAVHGDAREKDITLHIGLQLRDLLRRVGFGVIMTRETDSAPGGKTEVNADLNERCRIANAAKVDVFLSIHVNAGGGHGAEIYANGNGGPIAPLAKGIITNVSTVCGTHGQAVRDGGHNGEGWRVIVGTDMDAMLVEIGFIDTDDLSKIQTHIDEFAPLIASAICTFYGVSFPEAAAPAQKMPLNAAAVQTVINELGMLTKTASDAVDIAYNYAANSLRRALQMPITDDLGKPDKASADLVANSILGDHWKAAYDQDIRDCYHVAADALRTLL